MAYLPEAQQLRMQLLFNDARGFYPIAENRHAAQVCSLFGPWLQWLQVGSYAFASPASRLALQFMFC